jgi:hypothetical protein
VLQILRMLLLEDVLAFCRTVHLDPHVDRADN